MSNETLINFLASVELFSAFQQEELEKVAANIQIKVYDFGDTIFNTGTVSNGLYVIQSGTVRLFTQDQGKEISMGVRKEGEVFAELSILRSADKALSAAKHMLSLRRRFRAGTMK